jgi:phage FluMu protein gp41
MELFFLAQSGIEQRANLQRQCAAVGALDDTLAVKKLQIFANRDLRNPEMPGEIFDQHASIPVQDPEDFAAAFFVQ